MRRLLWTWTLLLLLLTVAACQVTPTPASTPLSDSRRLKILVRVDGRYQLSLRQLQQAGLAISQLSSTNLRLSQGGQDVPFWIETDQLIFWGEGPTSQYLAERPYILEVGQAGTMATAPPTPANSLPLTYHFEENLIYEPRARTPTLNDRWFWHKLGPGEVVSIPFELAKVPAQAARLTLNLWGFTGQPAVANDHDLALFVNGRFVTTLIWDGMTHHQETVLLKPELLQSGTNEIRLDNAAAGAATVDISLLNWVAVEFTESAASLTSAGLPAPPTPALMLMRTPYLRNQQKGAELLILADDALVPALQPLADARTAQGLSVQIVSPAQIYDEFGHGAATPTSIQRFLQHALANWQPAPRYLLLVGDGTVDYRNFLGNAPAYPIPAPLIPVQFGGETVSDARLGDVDGDGLADLAIGRWPVVSAAQVTAVVERTLAYETAVPAAQALFAADDSEPYFQDVAQRLWQQSGGTPELITLLTGPAATEVAQHWQAGAWLAAYVGHGSLGLWGRSAILDETAVPSLTAAAPPILLQFTCLTGLYAHPQQSSLSEQLLQAEDGPVLIVAATSLTYSSDQEPFAQALLQQLHDPTVQRMGDAIKGAKATLDRDSKPALQEVADTFLLFGDPSALIKRP